MALRSGLPRAWTDVKGTKANALRKKTNVVSCSTNVLSSANWGPSQLCMLSFAKKMNTAAARDRTRKRHLSVRDVTAETSELFLQPIELKSGNNVCTPLLW